eukprot:EG_transcript_1349
MGACHWVCLLLVLLCPFGATALYENEAGKHDWYKEKIGAVTQAVFPASPRLVKRRLVFVATEEATVAALHLQTGNVAWRKVLARGDSVAGIRLYDRTLLFLAGGRHLHACDAEDGTTVWTALLEPANAAGRVLFKGFLATPARTAAVLGIELPADPAGAPALRAFSFNVQDGTGLTERTIPLPPEAIPLAASATAAQRQVWLDTLVQLTSTGLVLLNPERGTATYVDGETGATSTVRLPAHATPDAVLPNARQQCPNVLVQLSPTAGVVLGVADQALRVTHTTANGALDRLVVCDDSLDEGQGLLVLRYQLDLSAARLQLRTAPAAPASGPPAAVDFEALAPDLLQLELPGGWTGGSGLRLAVANAYAVKGQPIAYRVLVGTEDAALGLLQGNGQVWHRLEGLASVSDAQFVNLPKPHTHQPNTENALLTRIGQRVLLQAVNLRESLGSFGHWVVEETLSRVQGEGPAAVGEAAEDSLDEGLAMTQDEFGFRKMILAFSKKTATLFAIHTVRGRVAWRHFLRPLVLTRVLEHLRRDPSPAELIQFAARCDVEVLAGHSLDEKHGQALWHDYLAVVAVRVYASPSARTAGDVAQEHYTVVLKFEVQSGKVADAHVYAFRPLHIAMLPVPFLVGTVSSTPLLLVDGALRPHLYPAVAAATEALRQNVARTFFHVMDAAAGRCVGYTISPDGKSCREAWRIALDRERQETVVGVSSTTLDRRAMMVHNTVRLFNNKTGANAVGPDYGFTYINPNAFAIATAVPGPPAGAEDKKSKAGPSINLYLIDGITGSILAQTTHQHAVPPVTLLHVENFLFYHFLSTKTMKYQLGSWQLFEDVTDAAAHTVAQGLLNAVTGSKLPPRSAFLLPPPLITRALYNYPTAVTCLGTSVTTKGITTKLVLAGNPLGQVVGLPLPLLEAPKSHVISYPLQLVVTYNKTVHHMRAIRTAPASLESSSHMLAIGLDLFYTRVAPAKAFDLLGEDFSHWLLLATTSALLVSTVVAKGFAKRRTLALAWA